MKSNIHRVATPRVFCAKSLEVIEKLGDRILRSAKNRKRVQNNVKTKELRGAFAWGGEALGGVLDGDSGDERVHGGGGDAFGAGGAEEGGGVAVGGEGAGLEEIPRREQTWDGAEA